MTKRRGDWRGGDLVSEGGDSGGGPASRRACGEVGVDGAMGASYLGRHLQQVWAADGGCSS